MKKKKIILLALFVLLVLLGAAVYFFSRPKDFFKKITEEFNQQAKQNKARVEKKNNLSIWWISPDDLNIINDNSTGIELATFNCLDDENLKNFKTPAKALGEKIDRIMQQSGFAVNQKNSSTSIEDSRFYDYIRAYEDKTRKCVFVASPDCSTDVEKTDVHYTFSFACTEKLVENYQAQAAYLKDLKIADAIVHLDKKSGDFIYLNVNYRRSGHYTIAKKENGKWIEIVSGQGPPQCSIIEKYQVPKEIAPTCWSGN